jgi:hygromycin-B 4-O-kinase
LRKPTLTIEAVGNFLGRLLDRPATNITRLVEGLESQAFLFEADGDAFVLRVSVTSRGFEKDRWAARVAGRHVPVPRVVGAGWIDVDHAYCVTEWAPGVTLEALPAAEVADVVDEVQQAWQALGGSDVSSVAGFGDFEPDGHAPFASWRDVLTTTLERASSALPHAAPVLGVYERLVDRCPEDHGLVHGDFGSNNVIVDDGRVTAVLDWENAMIGDPLYDVANTEFWATHLACMRVQAEHFSRTLADLPAYRERVLCYALRIGLEETLESRRDGDERMAKWALARCSELVAGYEGVTR